MDPRLRGDDGGGWDRDEASSEGTDKHLADAHHCDMQPCVYILASGYNGTLYVGVTSALPQRVWQHREEIFDGFTKRYSVKTLVYYEPHGSMVEAILREKQLKHWNRAWKIRLIEKDNPDWRDLYPEIAI
jgi:putative endonuclease